MRLALIRIADGVVENVIMAGEDYVPPEGYRTAPSDTAGIGWAHDGEEFVEPQSELPPEPVNLIGG